MKYILTFAICFLISMPAMATPHEDIAIKVNGMVCDFCAQSVWKVFEDYEVVNKVDVNLDTGVVTVHLKSGKTLDDHSLHEAITYAGYDLVSIERVQANHS